MTEGPFRRLARNHDFTVLWLGQTVSELGGELYSVARWARSPSTR